MVPVPDTVVIVADVPLLPPVVAVTVWAVAVVALVVNVIVAMPLPLVFDVAALKLPPFVLDHVTTCPDVDTALLLASASCAVTVMSLPAAGLVELGVTRYFAAAPATVVNVAVVPVLPPVVAVTVCAVPAVVLVVNVIVATPLASVFDVPALNDPPFVLDHVTT